jgi:hypothetical protein
MKSLAILVLCYCALIPAASAETPDPGKSVLITITGGHDTDPRDHGRPVVLIAAALNVPADLFRETFTHVTPAANGREPDPAQVRRNKEALLRGLAPHGVTNDRLDTVSNYYRYNARRDDLWRHRPATAYATIRDGVVTAITITDAGAGYTSAPKFSVPGLPQSELKARISLTTDLATNGSIQEIVVVVVPPPPAADAAVR